MTSIAIRRIPRRDDAGAHCQVCRGAYALSSATRGARRRRVGSTAQLLRALRCLRARPVEDAYAHLAAHLFRLALCAGRTAELTERRRPISIHGSHPRVVASSDGRMRHTCSLPWREYQLATGFPRPAAVRHEADHAQCRAVSYQDSSHRSVRNLFSGDRGTI